MAIKQLLQEFRDVFAWNYTEMPGLDPKMAMHYLKKAPGKKPVKLASKPKRASEPLRNKRFSASLRLLRKGASLLVPFHHTML